MSITYILHIIEQRQVMCQIISKMGGKHESKRTEREWIEKWKTETAGIYTQTYFRMKMRENCKRANEKNTEKAKTIHRT